MNLTGLNNEGDYKFRINQQYTTVEYNITQRCNLSCSYCSAWRSGEKEDSLTDKYSVGEIVDWFCCLQKSSGKRLYLRLSGGEPSLATNFGELVKHLTTYMDIGLQTNLCTKYIKDFAKNANPKRVGQVMATYQSETLDRNDSLRQLYLENFRLLVERDFTVVFKLIALPGEIPQLKDKIRWLRTQLSDDTPILVHFFIGGKVGPREHPNSYPYLYTEEEKRILQEVMLMRKTENFDLINGAGWFRGMKCDAGRGIIVMDRNGDAFRCWSSITYERIPLGNLTERNIQLLDAPKPCLAPYCTSKLWGLWYGVNPWDYIGKKADDCEYCRFSPIHLKDNQISPKLVKERKLLGMLDWRKNILDYTHTTKGRRATAKYYLRWANISKSAKDYKSATKYILKSFFLNLQTLPLLAIPFLTEKAVKGIRKTKENLKKIQGGF